MRMIGVDGVHMVNEEYARRSRFPVQLFNERDKPYHTNYKDRISMLTDIEWATISKFSTTVCDAAKSARSNERRGRRLSPSLTLCHPPKSMSQVRPSVTQTHRHPTTYSCVSVACAIVRSNIESFPVA